jgi:hypothetical protein
VSIQGVKGSNSRAKAEGSLIPALLQVAKESKAWEQSTEPLQQVFQTVINAMAREQSWGYLALL